MLNRAKTIYYRRAPVIAHLPGEEKSVELDEEGSGFPPDDSDGSGGGGNWLGGFFFFGLLAFLGFLEDKESEGDFFAMIREGEDLHLCRRLGGHSLLFLSFSLFLYGVTGVPFAVRILRRYNLLTGLTG